MVCLRVSVSCSRLITNWLVDRPHMGKGRHVPTRRRPFYVHRSVKTRMEAEGLEYKFKAEHAKDKEPIWVD